MLRSDGAPWGLSLIGCISNRQWVLNGWSVRDDLAVRTAHFLSFFLSFFTSLLILEATDLLVVKSGCEIRALLVAFVFLTSEDAATAMIGADSAAPREVQLSV